MVVAGFGDLASMHAQDASCSGVHMHNSNLVYCLGC